MCGIEPWLCAPMAFTIGDQSVIVNVNRNTRCCERPLYYLNDHFNEDIRQATFKAK